MCLVLRRSRAQNEQSRREDEGAAVDPAVSQAARADEPMGLDEMADLCGHPDLMPL
jgi:hypothetical protein